MTDRRGQPAPVARALGQDRDAGGAWIFRDVVDAVGQVDVELIARVDDAARAEAAAAKQGYAEHAAHAAALRDGGDRAWHQLGFGGGREGDVGAALAVANADRVGADDAEA